VEREDALSGTSKPHKELIARIRRTLSDVAGEYTRQAVGGEGGRRDGVAFRR
jgi:hypothetical protein